MSQQAEAQPGDPAGLLMLQRIKRNALVFLALAALASLWFRSLGSPIRINCARRCLCR